MSLKEEAYKEVENLVSRFEEQLTSYKNLIIMKRWYAGILLILSLKHWADVLNVAAEEQHAHKASVKATQQPALNKLMPLEKVIAFIKASLNPESIFLLHQSVDENKQEHFDLIVVISATSKTRFKYYEQVLTMANMEDIVINVSLHKAELLQQQLQEGHVYYSIACNNESLIYSTNSFEFPKTYHEALTVLAEKATTEFDAAHKKANDFLEGASNYHADGNNEMTEFMLQQAAELVLRGLIQHLAAVVPKHIILMN